jgi:hypothetical protein
VVERAQEFFSRWWGIVAIILSVVVTFMGMGVVWGVSMGKLTALSDGQTALVISNAALSNKIDVVFRELGDAKMAALMAKVQADHTQTQMDDLSRDFRALQQRLIVQPSMQQGDRQRP